MNKTRWKMKEEIKRFEAPEEDEFFDEFIDELELDE